MLIGDVDSRECRRTELVTLIEVPDSALDYDLCRYGASRVMFRGPKRPLNGIYIADIGSGQTYGKYVEVLFVDALEAQIGEAVVNLGVMQAGLTPTADSPDILPVTSNARMTLVQILGAQNMPNRFYSVHPRRNDRFVSASVTVQRLFPSVDFTDSHVTGHLLGALADTAQSALQSVVSELKIAWVSRLKMILKSISSDTVLLWMAERRPEDPLAWAIRLIRTLWIVK